MSADGRLGGLALGETVECRPGECGRAYELRANERVALQRWATLEYRLQVINETLERLEKRFWALVFGIGAVVLGTSALTLVAPI
ncbi:GTA head formation protein, RCAP_rcc01685 family [Tropicimonas sp. S265A]|uniref:GTA head formation protein, RCAP_rcc01685 family n=1 Tax=Tropicimonas sp. S265A TaxID=3415134 RepID=UPI003C7B8222